jgi:hypothetical protein
MRDSIQLKKLQIDREFSTDKGCGRPTGRTVSMNDNGRKKGCFELLI